MIKASCVICQEFFQTEQSIYSTVCGHVFHEVCLLKWIQTSPTCPHCRASARLKNVVRLYFETDTDDVDDLDPTKLKNELDHVSAELAGFNKVRKDLQKEKCRVETKLKKVNSELKEMTADLQTELTTNEALRKQLKYLIVQGDEAKEAKRTALMLRQKLAHFERLQMVLTANADAVTMMLKEQGDSSRACKDLATYCVSLKREFENVKNTKRRMKEELATVKKELTSKTKQLNDCKTQNDNNSKHIKMLEEELTSLEKDKENLKRKLTILQKSVNSPSGAKGAITRLLFESPTPYSMRAPKLQGPEHWESDTSLDITMNPGSPATPDFVIPSPSLNTKQECKEFGIPYIKTTSIATSQKRKNTDDDSTISVLATSSLFNSRRPLGDRHQSTIRKGYNGLGGHHTVFTKSNGLSRMVVKQTTRPSKKLKTTTGLEPPLPTLDQFIS